ncbi:MAG: hypothetical protein ACXW36_08980 [Nitrospira sp.]
MLTGDEHYEEVAEFWPKIFALNFGFGVTETRSNFSSGRTGRDFQTMREA